MEKPSILDKEVMQEQRAVNERFMDLVGAKRVWAIAAVQGRHEALTALHAQILSAFEPGDRIVYLGGIIGNGDLRATLTEIFRFRRSILAKPPLMMPQDIVYLRGQQEEMWNKLQQIHFAPNPKELLEWMFERGVANTLEAYGQSSDDALVAARDGMVELSRWTGRLKAVVQATPGHADWYRGLRRYAMSGEDGCLFVHAGLNPDQPLTEQKDAFWWETARFDAASAGFENFKRIVRGYDPASIGLSEKGICLTLDSRPDRPLQTCCLSSDGRILGQMSA